MWPKNVQINIWFSRNATGRKQVLAQQRKWRRKTLLASLTWSWNPNVPNLTDPRRCLDLATRKLALLAVGSCFKNDQPPRTSFLESPAEKIAAIVTKTDQKMPKDRTILSSSSQKARARTCKEKDEERSAHAPKEPENGCHGVAMVRQTRCTGRTSSCVGVQRRYKSRANRRRVDVFEPKDDDVRWTKPQQKKAKRRRCSRVQANVEGLFKYTLNSEPKALTGDKSEGIKSRGAAEAFIRGFSPVKAEGEEFNVLILSYTRELSRPFKENKG